MAGSNRPIRSTKGTLFDSSGAPQSIRKAEDLGEAFAYQKERAKRKRKPLKKKKRRTLDDAFTSTKGLGKLSAQEEDRLSSLFERGISKREIETILRAERSDLSRREMQLLESKKRRKGGRSASSGNPRPKRSGGGFRAPGKSGSSR